MENNNRKIEDIEQVEKNIIYINPYDVIDEGAEVITKYLDSHGLTGEEALLKLSIKQKKELIKIMEEYWDNNFVDDSFINKLSYLKSTLEVE
jgi:hypothetical protein